MRGLVIVVLVTLAVAGGAPAQTTNSRYDVRPFGAPPNGQPSWVDTISVAADGKGSILVFRRADPPVVIFDREGKLLRTWGDGLFPDKHSIDVDHEGFVWITDRTDHMVYKFTLDGRPLMTLGKKGVAGGNSSRDTFNRPNDVFVARNGDIFVSDGY